MCIARFLHSQLRAMASPSGIPQLGELAPGAHVGQLYRTQQDLLETLVPFFAAGLAAHERCVWVTSTPVSATQARAALAAAVPDLAHRERIGQIEIIDHGDWYTASGDLSAGDVIAKWLALEEAALRAGYRALRVSGNTNWLRPDQWDAFVEYEMRAHAAFQSRKIVALCSYSLASCHSHDVVDVLRNHSVSIVRTGEAWEVVHGATAALLALEPTPLDVRDNRPPHVSVDGTDLAELTSALATEMARRQAAEAAYEASRAAQAQLVRLDRLAAALGEVTMRGKLVDVITDVVASTLGVDCLVTVECHEPDRASTLVEHGDAQAVAALRGTLDAAGASSMWSAAVGGPLRAAVVLPVLANGTRLASCAFGFTREHALDSAFRALAQDVTRQIGLALDRVLAYERLEHERERAELANRAKDEFLAMLGHELRNPLSPILTATQLMRLRGDTVHEKERIVIERQCKHMIRLVDDLLDVSRITRGKVDLRRRAVEISEVVAAAVELASPALEERAHKLTLDVPGAGVVVHADPARLAQVICNLLTNAAKYTPQGGAVHVGVKVAASTVTVSVRDDGIGIDGKLLPHIFDSFVQGRQGIDRAAGGLGLGLAIAKSILELHGGSIRAASAGHNRGSELTFELPRYANTRPTQRASASGGFSVPGIRKRRVLVVDDNEDAAFLFSEALKRLGHHVEVAHDGPSALAVARENPPEIAFLDIGLPVMDGYELGRRLLELAGDDAPPLHLVAVTGYGHTSDRERSREAGFDLHLVKPIELAQVQDALQRLD
jgi:signal transduction histidine kinase